MGQNNQPDINQSLDFRSSDIKNTKSNEKTNYFVKTKEHATYRRMKRQEMYQALKERHQQKALSRRQYFSEWFKIYRAPIAIIFLIVAIIAITLLIVFNLNNQPKYVSNTIVEINSNMSEEELTTAITKVFAEEGSDAGLAECERLLPTINASPERQAAIYLHCSRQLSQYDNRNYYPTILKYAYAAEDILHSYDTARTIADYEMLYGSPEKGIEYNRIASERDPTKSQEVNGETTPNDQPIVIDTKEGEPITSDEEDLPEDTSDLIITDVVEWVDVSKPEDGEQNNAE